MSTARSAPVAGIPIIAASALHPDAPDHDAAVEQLGRACAEWGFFQLVDHGLPAVDRRALFDQQRHFFGLPEAAKLTVARTAANARGYNPGELTKNRRDWKQIFDFGHVPEPTAPDDAAVNRTLDGWNQFPPELPTFRAAAWRWYRDCEALAFVVLRAMSEALGLPRDALDAAFDPRHSSFLRLNHYPACTDPAPADAADFPAAGRLGIHHHTDAGALTLLVQEGPAALQVRRGGVWQLVEPEPDAFVVNVGDMVQVWSNDRFVAPEHRVLASPAGAERASAAFFFNPDFDAVVAPRVASADQPAVYRPFTWGEFRRRRADGDYADLGEEVQISQYRRA